MNTRGQAPGAPAAVAANDKGGAEVHQGALLTAQGFIRNRIFHVLAIGRNQARNTKPSTAQGIINIFNHPDVKKLKTPEL